MPTEKSETVPSPCISICSIDDDVGYCRGCYRMQSEVAGWISFTNEQKLAVLEAIKARKQQYPKLGER